MPIAAKNISDHFDGKTFFMPGLQMLKGFGDLLKWSLNRQKAAWPAWTENAPAVPFASSRPTDTWHLHYVNHASVYVRTPGLSFVTDPVWSLRTSPFTFAGPKRARPPGFALESLPELDLVLISHNHYDHLDVASLRRLHKQYDPQFLCALGDGKILAALGITKFHEMDWHESFEFKGQQIYFLPAQHWSARGMFDRNHSLWGSFMVKSDLGQFYFAGDTGYGPFFSEIYKRYGAMDFSLLPIGAYEPRWFMREMHMNPEDAMKSHLDLHSKASMAIHFGTWQLTDEAIDDPEKALAVAVKAHPEASPFHVILNGQALVYDRRQQAGVKAAPGRG